VAQSLNNTVLHCNLQEIGVQVEEPFGILALEVRRKSERET
jgi:hypothetical protein